jgi:hypothetical protein
MARAALGWSLRDAAKISSLGLSTVRRAETEEGFTSLTEANRRAITSAFIDAGIIFTGDADTPGVQLVVKPR